LIVIAFAALDSGQTVSLSGGISQNVNLNPQLEGTTQASTLTLGSVITADWVNPDDPRDRATGRLFVTDATPEQAAITFKKVDGSPITGSLSDGDADSVLVELNYNKPYLGSSFTVTLTTATGDALDVVVQQDIHACAMQQANDLSSDTMGAPGNQRNLSIERVVE